MRENTGLTDIQGKDIFVGDILTTEHGEECEIVRKFGGWYRVWKQEGKEWETKVNQKLIDLGKYKIKGED